MKSSAEVEMGLSSFSVSSPSDLITMPPIDKTAIVSIQSFPQRSVIY